MTFGFWYRLTEDLYHAHDESLNTVFRQYAQRLVVAMYKHCHIEPDHVRFFQNCYFTHE
jgi:transportin-3